jgi:hypothetical protein
MNNERRSKPGSLGIDTDYGVDQNGRLKDLVSPLVIKKRNFSTDKNTFKRQFTQNEAKTPSLGGSQHDSAQSVESDKPRRSKKSKKSKKKSARKKLNLTELEQPLIQNMDGLDTPELAPQQDSNQHFNDF